MTVSEKEVEAAAVVLLGRVNAPEQEIYAAARAALEAAASARADVPVAMAGLTLAILQRAHGARQEEWCPDQKPDLSFRGNEMAGEVGEACNVIKKLERERQGWRGSRATKEQLAEELADVIHTAILCAITAGIEIEPATVAKFNSTSEKNGLASRIRSALVSAPAQEPVAWQWRMDEAHEWLWADNPEWYRANGAEVRALYAAPASPEQGGE